MGSAVRSILGGAQAMVKRTTHGGIGVPWRAKVTRVVGSIAYVEIPLYAKGLEFKCEDYSGAGQAVSTSGGAGTVEPLNAGDLVVVEFWGSDDPVIVSRRV